MFSAELLQQVEKTLNQEAKADTEGKDLPALMEIKQFFRDSGQSRLYFHALAAGSPLENVLISIMTAYFSLGRRYAELEMLEGMTKEN